MTTKHYISENEELMKLWDWEANKELNPANISIHSHKRVWWKCEKCGYLWQQAIIDRIDRNNSVRKCKNCLHKSNAGIDDLATLRPEIAKEWHPTKNGELTPQDVKQYSNKKVWWLCPNNHEYQARIGERTRRQGTNCPICYKQCRTSFPEQAFYYYIKQLYSDAINGFRAEFLENMELDIYIPSLNWGIEYDGEAWHRKDKLKREQKKYKKCVENGIKLIRIREKIAPLCSDIADEQIQIIQKDGKDNLEETIKYILKRINFTRKSIVIDLDKDEIKIREEYQSKIKDSVAELYPELIKDWHPTKNGHLTPNDCKAGSVYKVWWKCPTCGYEWQASPQKRCGRGHGCLNCSKQAPLVGVNDLATLYPEIAKEWHPIKNGNIKPTDIRPKSNRIYWWKCSKCGYEWQATGNNRIGHKSGCPACAGRVPVIGVSDFFTVCPELKKEWDNELNQDIDITTLPLGSHTKVWWKCEKCAHRWQSEVRQRVKGLGKCPNCSKHSKRKK
ncbi:MAG: zinc-ribbon domain-containing protein [Alphaproteobacteria bacterium]|nr:zinc-ribbon domain-containing protein [Alphaproteobacteria bacterium]